MSLPRVDVFVWNLPFRVHFLVSGFGVETVSLRVVVVMKSVQRIIVLSLLRNDKLAERIQLSNLTWPGVLPAPKHILPRLPAARPDPKPILRLKSRQLLDRTSITPALVHYIPFRPTMVLERTVTTGMVEKGGNGPSSDTVAQSLCVGVCEERVFSGGEDGEVRVWDFGST